jgi:hypothetical protein
MSQLLSPGHIACRHILGERGCRGRRVVGLPQQYSFLCVVRVFFCMLRSSLFDPSFATAAKGGSGSYGLPATRKGQQRVAACNGRESARPSGLT